MHKNVEAAILMFEKNVRVFSYTRNRIFTIKKLHKPLTVEQLIEYADTPVNDGFDNIVSDVVHFSDLKYDRFKEEMANTDNDFVVVHEPINTQIFCAETGVVIWKKLD